MLKIAGHSDSETVDAEFQITFVVLSKKKGTVCKDRSDLDETGKLSSGFVQ